MDYFAEIADSSDVEEAVDRLIDDPGYPHALCGHQDGRLPLSVAHPSIWRLELLNWFHIHPAFAAKVWLALGYCASQRARLARTATLSPWPTDSVRSKSAISLLKILGLASDASHGLFESRLADASDDQIDEARSALWLDYRGPAFIEHLLQEVGRKETVAVRIADRAKVRDPAKRLLQETKRKEDVVGLIADRAKVRALAEKHEVPVPFSMVHEEELEQIEATRTQCERMRDNRVPSLAAPTAEDEDSARRPTAPSRDMPLRQALAKDLVGLAFSGGGIRSATFNLGVLQALAQLDILRHCDYLSTVSGGGYIGSWLAAWMLREAQASNRGVPLTAKQVQDRMRLRLSPSHSPHPLDSRIRPIRYLREFSNYLTPQTGFFSADTWTMVAIYIRNLTLNLLVLIPLMAAILLAPRLVFSVTHKLVELRAPALILSLIAVFFILPLGVLLPNLRRASPHHNPLKGGHEAGVEVDARDSEVPWYAAQGWIQILVVAPFLIASCLLATHYWTLVRALDSAAISLVASTAGGVFFVYLGLIHWVGRFYRCWPRTRQAIMALVIATIGAAGAAAGLFWVLGHILAHFSPDAEGEWLAVAFGTPMALSAYSFIVVIQLGLLGAKFPDEQREWWSRLRAWTLIYSLGWAGLFTSALWIPPLVGLIAGSDWSVSSGAGGLAVWLVSTVLGIRAGRSGTLGADSVVRGTPSSSGGSAPSSWSRVVRVVALVAPYVFIVGLVVLVSLGVQAALRVPFDAKDQSTFWSASTNYALAELCVMALGLVAISVFISWRIGVNEFSMHHFYKNRLVRCFLGASRWSTRKANWFTGFDANDDVPLARFDHRSAPKSPGAATYHGPYPIWNAALNLVAGEDLAWQERKATSFVFTPKYCGYDLDRAVLQRDKGGYWPDAYAPTSSYVNAGFGPMLGSAMAISGAAANPNMGRVTSSPLAFLLTVFNARLGWWLPNTRRKGSGVRWDAGWDRSGPTMGINYTAIELLGMTDDNKRYVNLSDGGHFENLGVYELIRRGCRYIIVSDAGQDRSLGLEDLGNLIRKCRTDFGVEIEIGTDSIRDRGPKGWSGTHCVVGKIHYLSLAEHDTARGEVKYVNGRPRHEEGLLIYLKATISGDEPFDILEYHRRVPEFPHETTADQWFNESQFESYRRLGLHIAEAAFARHRENPEEPIASLPTLFAHLRDFWHPPSPKIAEHATDRAEQYSRIMEMLRSNDALRFLDPILFGNVPTGGLGKDRDEFYVCNALLQLMENVYHDLDLEQNWTHPHVAGWIAVFKHWATQDSFRRAWRISRNTFAPRFQRFFEERLAK